MMRYKRPAILSAIAFIIILIAIAIWQSLTFHLVKIEPGNGSQPNQYTAVSFMFNKPIKSQGDGVNQITITPSVEGKITVSDKAVTFVPTSSFQTNTAYSAVLSKVMSKGGKTLSNMTVSFTPQYVDYADLPKDVQQRLVAQTDTNDSQKPTYSAGDIAIDGSNELSNHGVTSQQLDDLQIAFYNFFVSKKEQIRGVVLTNIVKQPRDPHNPNAVDTITFLVKLNNDKNFSYQGRILYPDLASLRLYLYKPSGALIFDSGQID